MGGHFGQLEQSTSVWWLITTINIPVLLSRTFILEAFVMKNKTQSEKKSLQNDLVGVKAKKSTTSLRQSSLDRLTHHLVPFLCFLVSCAFEVDLFWEELDKNKLLEGH